MAPSLPVARAGAGKLNDPHSQTQLLLTTIKKLATIDSYEAAAPMLLELARPIVLLGCILSLLKLFHAAFLEPAATNLQRLEDALGPFLLAAAIALLGALVFLPARRAAAIRKPVGNLPDADLLLDYQRHGNYLSPRLVSRNPLHLLPRRPFLNGL